MSEKKLLLIRNINELNLKNNRKTVTLIGTKSQIQNQNRFGLGFRI